MTTPADGELPAGIPDDEVVDARGLRCPLPVIRLAARARDLPPGTLITVVATDPAARHDVPAWARMRGHTMAGEAERREIEDDGGPAWVLTVRLGDGT